MSGDESESNSKVLNKGFRSKFDSPKSGFRLSTKQINAQLNEHPTPQIVPHSLHSILTLLADLKNSCESKPGLLAGLAVRRSAVLSRLTLCDV